METLHRPFDAQQSYLLSLRANIVYRRIEARKQRVKFACK